MRRKRNSRTTISDIDPIGEYDFVPRSSFYPGTSNYYEINALTNLQINLRDCIAVLYIYVH